EHDQWNCHHARTFMRMSRSLALAAEKHVDHLSRHIEGGENNAGHHQIKGERRSVPMRGRMKDFLFRPCAGKEKRDTAKCHHSDSVSGKRDRHHSAQAAHFTNVLLVMTAVNDRTGTEKQERFEKTVSEQVH